MADTDILRLFHPETGGVFEATRVQYEQVYQHKGWEITAPDTPLTDQRYTKADGEPQPPPAPDYGDAEAVPAGAEVLVEEAAPTRPRRAATEQPSE